MVCLTQMSLSTQYLLDDVWLLNPVLGPPIQDRLKNWREFRGGHQDGRGWSTYPVRKVWESWACSVWSRDGFGGPDSSHPCAQGGHWGDGVGLLTVVRGGRLTDNRHKVKQERVRLNLGRHFFPMKTVSGRGCPERLSSLRPQRFLSPNWMKPWEAWSDLRADVLLTGGGIRHPWGSSLSESSCDPVVL